MSKIILYVAVSKDGFIADKDGGVGWLESFSDADYGYEEFMSSVGSLVIGSATYDQILTFGSWPYIGKKSYIMTQRNLEPHSSKDVVITHDDPAEVLRIAKQEAGEKNVWLVGGAKLAQAFLEQCLLDEIMLFTIPIEITEGIALFEDVSVLGGMKLVDSKEYGNGALFEHYFVQ